MSRRYHIERRDYSTGTQFRVLDRKLHILRGTFYTLRDARTGLDVYRQFDRVERRMRKLRHVV